MHLRYLGELDNSSSALIVTQNDYFNAISGIKMNLPDISILTTQGNIQIAPREFTIINHTSNLISSLIAGDAKSLLHFLLEYEPSKIVIEYLARNYPDANDYITSKTTFRTARLQNANKTFDEIAVKQDFKLKGEILENVEIWHQRFIIKGNVLLEFDEAGSHRLPFEIGRAHV